MPKSEKFQQLPAPWDRIFSHSTRIFVWGLLAGIVYLLRPFFLLIFLTFVFAYIQAHGVEGLEHRIKHRVTRVVVVLFVFLGVIVGTTFFMAPHVQSQMEEYLDNSDRYLAQADDAIYDFADAHPSLRSLLDGAPTAGDGEQGRPAPKTKERPPIFKPFVMRLFAGGEDENAKIEDKLQGVVAAGAGILGATSSFLLAILFSFLIVLDLPKLTRMVQSLGQTKLDFIYEEASTNIQQFGKRLGRTLEAQLIIAIVNTILTSIGIWVLGIPNITFLAAVVFFCSFIPVAGVFISSVPICLLALQTGGDEGGIQLMLLTIGMVLLVHTIEAYILNPKIYGHHLHMNAVLVLIILTIAGKLFGVWGLVLGLPVTNYFFAIAIQHDPEEAAGEKDGDPPKPDLPAKSEAPVASS